MFRLRSVNRRCVIKNNDLIIHVRSCVRFSFFCSEPQKREKATVDHKRRLKHHHRVSLSLSLSLSSRSRHTDARTKGRNQKSYRSILSARKTAHKRDKTRSRLSSSSSFRGKRRANLLFFFERRWDDDDDAFSPFFYDGFCCVVCSLPRRAKRRERERERQTERQKERHVFTLPRWCVLCLIKKRRGLKISSSSKRRRDEKKMIESEKRRPPPRWNIIIHHHHLAFEIDTEREIVIIVIERELFIRTLYSRAPVVSMTHISVGLEAIFVCVSVFRCV